jgi:4-amino-4-deoxy-L-arabinose transferase-like glycosyltransferase
MNRTILLAAALIPLFFYVQTLNPTVSTYADAGEFPTAAYLNGFAHPPGYPLFTLIVKAFTLLPFGNNPAYKSNLAAAVISAAAVAVFYLLARRLTQNTYSSFLASQLFAFAPIYWRNALVSEVFGLLVFFIALTFLLFIIWTETKNKNYYYLFLLAAGFGLGHHQLLVLTLIPLFLYFLLTKKWQLIKIIDIPLGILTVLIGFTPYLYIYFYAARHLQVMNWENPSTLDGLFKLIARDNYGTFTLTNEFRQTDITRQVGGIFGLFYSNYRSLGSVLIALGSAFLIYLKKWRLLLYSFLILITAFLFSVFSGMPAWQTGQIQYLERFILLSHVFASLLIAFGISLALKALSQPRLLHISAVSVLLVSAALSVAARYSEVNQKDNYFADNLADDFYASLPENSLFIMEGDANINTLLYHRFVLGKRPDVYLLLGGLLSVQKPWYLAEISRLYPGLVIPETGKNQAEFLTRFIDSNSGNRRIFFYLPRMEEDLKLDLPKINRGLVWEFVTDPEKVDITQVQTDIQNLLAGYQNLQPNQPTYPPQSSEYSMLNLYLQPYLYLARLNHDDLTQSEKYYRRAIEIKPDSYQARLELGDDYLMHGKEAKAVKMYREALVYIHDRQIKNNVLSAINEIENN